MLSLDSKNNICVFLYLHVMRDTFYIIHSLILFKILHQRSMLRHFLDVDPILFLRESHHVEYPGGRQI